MEIEWQPPVLRHFRSRLRPVGGQELVAPAASARPLG
jgi:hypothetical protein